MATHLVTGGSGFVGSNIARILHERGERVRVLDLWREESLPPDIDYVQADITDQAAVEKAMSGISYVHHTVALVPLTKAGRRFHDVNVGGTEIALRAAMRERVRMFANMSSSAIFGAHHAMPITLETPMQPVESYGQAKYEADCLVRRAGSEGFPVSTIRPRTVLGAGRLGIFEILFEWIRDNANIYVMGSGDNLFQFIHNDDLAEVSIQSCLQEKTGVFNAGTDRFGTLREDLGALIVYANSRSRVKSLPAGLTAAALSALDKLNLSPLGPYHYMTYHRPFYFDVEPVKAALNWTPRYSNQEILSTSYDSFLARETGGPGGGHKSVHKKSVKQGVLRLLKALS